MERTIDRTSYRRSGRESVKKVEKENKSFKYLNIFLNQIIVSLLIVVVLLVLNYFEVVNIESWVYENMAKGYEFSEIFALIKNKFSTNEVDYVMSSGEVMNVSGDNLVVSGEISGEVNFKTAVEGINQMAEDAKVVNSKYDFILPLNGTITSEFGCRESNSATVSSYHVGLDIAANTGTNIFAAHSGTVTLAKNFSTYGNCVMIENGGLVTLYAHCSSLNVKEGQKVEKGDLIAKVGMTGNATGPHLHFEVRYEGRFVNPKDVLGEI